MNRRLTPEERRIIERTRRESRAESGAADPADPADTDGQPGQPRRPGQPGQAGQNAVPPLWRSVLSWIGAIALLVFLALAMLYIGTLVS